MATAGSNILALDYNSIQTQVASILGAPVAATPSTGYNQTVQSAQVTASSSVITQDQWQRLKNDITNCARHQNTTITDLDNLTITQGNPVYAANNTPFTTATAAILANRLVMPSVTGQFTTGTLSALTFTNDWKTQLTHTVTVAWSTAAAMSAFFNAGGYISFTASRDAGNDNPAGGFPQPQNKSWDDLLGITGGTSVLGTVYFKYNGCSNSLAKGTGSGIGVYNLTSGELPLYTYSGGSYAGNDYTIKALCPGVASNSGGAANSITFRIYFNDGAKVSSLYDLVTGTFRSTVGYLNSTGTIATISPPVSGTPTFTGS